MKSFRKSFRALLDFIWFLSADYIFPVVALTLAIGGMYAIGFLMSK